MSADSPAARAFPELREALGRLDDPWSLDRCDTEEVTAEFGAAQLDTVRARHESSLFLRIWCDGRVGCVTATPGAVPVAELISSAREIARYGAGDEPVPEAGEAPSQAQEGPDGPQLAPTRSAADEIQLLRADLQQLQRETRLVCHATVRINDVRLRQARQGRVMPDVAHRVSHANVVVEGWDDPGLRFEWTHWGRSAALGPEAREWFSAAGSWQDLPAAAAVADGDLLLAPPAVHALLTPLVRSLDGAALASGRSFLPRELGDPVCSPRLSLVDGIDDGDWPDRPSADDEGTAPRLLRLVDQGVAAHAFHSRMTARAVAERPTGHGFRGTSMSRKPLQPVAPAVSNVMLSPGNTSFTDLIAGMRHGTIVESLIGANQASVLTPQTQGRIRLGFTVEKGQVRARTRGQAISWDLRELLGCRFVAASKQTWPVGRTWTGRLPFVLARREH